MNLLSAILFSILVVSQFAAAQNVDATSLRGKVLCGYQGWFRCPGDESKRGWVHWSRDSKRIAPETLTFEMWPDLTGFSAAEKFPATGFTHANGAAAELFSSDNAATVRRHFDWMREHRIDGVWLQHFVVDEQESRMRVLRHVSKAATETGRIWALTFDMAGTPVDRVVEKLTRQWHGMVDANVTRSPGYVHEKGKPVVEVWGFYPKNGRQEFTPEICNAIIDIFKAPGKYEAFLVGGGDWNWRRNTDANWQTMLKRLDAISPWNVGNTSREGGVVRAATGPWAADQRECEARGQLWLPVVYPGFSWDNLQRKAPGSTNIPRRSGAFLWEQFHALSKLGVSSVKVAMFDEVDEGTAIFKVSNSPPQQGHFVTYEGLPSDWYLRLVGEATRLLREKKPVPAEIPIKP